MANPSLEAEIRVMLATEKKVLRELSMAYSNISKDLTELQRKQGPSAMLERAQLRRVKTAIKGEMAGMWSRVGNEIRAGRIQAAGAAVGLASEAEKLFRAAGLTSTEIATMQRSMTLAAESSVDAAMRRMQGESYRPLSDKVYHTQVLVNGQLDRVINQAMLKEANAASLSKAVRGFIRPDTAGGVRYASNRLARTEINNAFHASAVKGMQSEPFTKNVLWNLSGSHARPDVCNDYAEEPHVLGGEAGVWSPMEVPERPHPNCLCFVTAITVSDEEFINAFSEGKYDDWLKDEIGYEPSPLDRPLGIGGRPIAMSTRPTPAMKAHLDSVVSLNSPSASLQVRAELERQAQLTPKSIKKLSKVTDSAGPNAANMTSSVRASAYYESGPRSIHFTEAGLKGADRKAWEKSGYLSKCGHSHTSIQSVTAHEYGHHINHMIDGIYKTKGFDKVLDLRRLDDVLKRDFGISSYSPRGSIQLPEHIKVDVSGYGATNLQEMFAEVWAEYSTNPNARSKIKKLGDLMKELAEKHGKSK